MVRRPQTAGWGAVSTFTQPRGILSVQETARTLGSCAVRSQQLRWPQQLHAVARSGLWQPGLGEEQGQPSDDSEVHGRGRNCPATAPCASSGPVGFCVVCLSQPTPWLPTELHREAGEVNFQQPPEFLLTFFGVFVI